MKELNVQKLIQVALSKAGSVMFRINVGRAWTGNDIRQLADGSILIKDPRPFRTGVPNGYSDLTGWTPIIVTAEMVGRKIAVFTACEVKSEAGRLSSDQSNFLHQALKAGAIAGVARSPKDAVELLSSF